jgi:hypothetical protein
MTENDYQLAWSLYVVAALGCLLVWFRMTGWLWRWLREPLRLLVAVLLLTPSLVDPAAELYAPAIAMASMDLLFQNAYPVQPLADLASFSMIAMTIYLVFAILRWPLESWLAARNRPAAPSAAPEPTLRELLQNPAGGSAEQSMRREPHL